MWPPQPPELPPRQPFQTFSDRRRALGRRRIGLVVALVVLVGAVFLARSLFPAAEAKIRQRIGAIFAN
jgi:hypothetical protein